MRVSENSPTPVLPRTQVKNILQSAKVNIKSEKYAVFVIIYSLNKPFNVFSLRWVVNGAGILTISNHLTNERSTFRDSDKIPTKSNMTSFNVLAKKYLNQVGN